MGDFFINNKITICLHIGPDYLSCEIMETEGTLKFTHHIYSLAFSWARAENK